MHESIVHLDKVASALALDHHTAELMLTTADALLGRWLRMKSTVEQIPHPPQGCQRPPAHALQQTASSPASPTIGECLTGCLATVHHYCCYCCSVTLIKGANSTPVEVPGASSFTRRDVAVALHTTFLEIALAAERVRWWVVTDCIDLMSNTTQPKKGLGTTASVLVSPQTAQISRELDHQNQGKIVSRKVERM